ncbi:Cobyrinate a,c-diamide synthase [Frankliniella fusca]|uniref:Cobyrinate a,c-diamide synthase n=1 Tax=Frankliniella fusca TaxID=407009 RepID=A0AAE1LLB9_9NEOP|nr:Cobyrinate a,c-diamide synthase [Frankliniella fusca]
MVDLEVSSGDEKQRSLRTTSAIYESGSLVYLSMHIQLTSYWKVVNLLLINIIGDFRMTGIQ